jgi:hypothetical protein
MNDSDVPDVHHRAPAVLLIHEDGIAHRRSIGSEELIRELHDCTMLVRRNGVTTKTVINHQKSQTAWIKCKRVPDYKRAPATRSSPTGLAPREIRAHRSWLTTMKLHSTCLVVHPASRELRLLNENVRPGNRCGS